MKKKGFFFNKLNYRKYGKNNPKKVREEIDQELQPVIEQLEEMTLEEELQTLIYFKTCSVGKDVDILKIRLSRTVDLREKVLRKRETKFAESFPFYFVDPNLVYQIKYVLNFFSYIKCYSYVIFFRFSMITQSDSQMMML